MNACLLSRRTWLSLFGMAGAAYLTGEMTRSQTLVPATAAVDHLLLGTADLDQGIEWVERLTGVKAVIGGSHPGVGTRNALISLGGRQYLEVIAPDPQQTAYNFHIDVRTLREPRLITWAALTADIQAVAARAREAGYQMFGPIDGSRTRPDGKALQWKTLGVLTQFGSGGVEPIPFFIEWAPDSVHPSQDSPQGCQLESLAIRHSEPSRITAALNKLGIKANVQQATEAGFNAILNSPKGRIELA